MIAARAVELQLAAEQEAIINATHRMEMANRAKELADEKSALEARLYNEEQQRASNDKQAVLAFQQKLDAINGLLAASEQRMQLSISECEATEARLAAEQEEQSAILQNIAAEHQVAELSLQRAALETEAESITQQKIALEQHAIEAITLRMDTELRAIEANNECIELEVRAQEIASARIIQEEALATAAKEKEEITLRAMNMVKLEVETLQKAIKAEEEALQQNARAAVMARKRISAADEVKRIEAQNEMQEIALIEQDQRNQEIALAHAQLLARELEAKELANVELLQHNKLVQARIDALHQECLDAERSVEAEAEMRSEAERQAAELARQRALSERLARKAAEEKLQLQEKLKATAMSRAALDFKKSDAMRFELNKSNAAFETEKLLSRLRKSALISKLSQAALMATLVITAGLWIATPQFATIVPIQAGSIATVIQAPAQDERIEVNGMKMSTELTMPEKVALNTVTQ